MYSSIDSAGRYAFGNQPNIIAWNLTRLAEALLPLLSEDEARSILGTVQARWNHHWEASADALASELVFMPRNQMLQRAITAAERDGDFARYFELLAAVTDPYNPGAGPEWMAQPEGDAPFITYCGT